MGKPITQMYNISNGFKPKHLYSVSFIFVLILCIKNDSFKNLENGVHICNYELINLKYITMFPGSILQQILSVI